MLFFRRKREDADVARRLAQTAIDLIHDQYVPRSHHEQRVRELLDANNVQLERRRAAERECEHTEREVLRAVKVARQNTGLALAFDWAKTNIPDQVPAFATLSAVKTFVAAFAGESRPACHNQYMATAYDAGVAARSRQTALDSASQAMGIIIPA